MASCKYFFAKMKQDAHRFGDPMRIEIIEALRRRVAWRKLGSDAFGQSQGLRDLHDAHILKESICAGQ